MVRTDGVFPGGGLRILVGVFEVVLGLAVLYRPLRSLLVLVLVWKLGTELLRPLVGQPNYQFVERAGDYVLPLVLFWLLAQCSQHFAPTSGRRSARGRTRQASAVAT